MESLFDELLEAYKATHVSINGKEVQIECTKIWQDLRKEKKNGPAVKAGLANLSLINGKGKVKNLQRDR